MNDFDEHGGKRFAKVLIMAWIKEVGPSSEALIASVVGLPRVMVQVLLEELAVEGALKKK